MAMKMKVTNATEESHSLSPQARQALPEIVKWLDRQSENMSTEDADSLIFSVSVLEEQMGHLKSIDVSPLFSEYECKEGVYSLEDLTLQTMQELLFVMNVNSGTLIQDIDIARLIGCAEPKSGRTWASANRIKAEAKKGKTNLYDAHSVFKALRKPGRVKVDSVPKQD